MNLSGRLGEWLDVRPGEGAGLVFSTMGAFFVIGALTLGRAMREAMFLSQFTVENLPYITVTVALLSLPAVRIFTRLIDRFAPRLVMNWLVLVIVLGLTILWPLAGDGAAGDVVIILFYIWTSLGILLTASGFWIVISELFAVRGAKRLFGLISAGGTAGALVTGLSLSWLSAVISQASFFPILIAFMLLFLISQRLLPPAPSEAKSRGSKDEEERARVPMGDSIRAIWVTPHLRAIALIVISATMASTLIDYQFKEAVTRFFAASPQANVDMTAFFGGFYGWTGGIALVLQLLVSGRLIAGRGVGPALAVLPLALLAGSAGLVLLPGLLLATVLRGADNSLRKSIFRPTLEILYLPLPVNLRRRTKTFIDTVLDTVSESMGAAIIFLMVTLLDISSIFLSLIVVLLALLFLCMSRRMDRQYLATIVQRLGEEAQSGQKARGNGKIDDDLLSATFTRLDIKTLLGEQEGWVDLAPGEYSRKLEDQDPEHMSRLSSGKLDEARQAIARNQNWDEAHLRRLLLLLARNELKDEVSAKLIELQSRTETIMVELLADESQDFVIRRRIPRLLTVITTTEADDALLAALQAGRFEIRYRSAQALVKRREREMPRSPRDGSARIWDAIRGELSRGKPIWELQKLFDGNEEREDDLVGNYVDQRGALSLEHTFRMLSLVLDDEPIRAAFDGIMRKNDVLNNYALEYLEQVLPADVRDRLWQFIGDLSERKRAQAQRPIDDVVSDLMATQMTLFASDDERAALMKMLEDSEEPSSDD